MRIRAPMHLSPDPLATMDAAVIGGGLSGLTAAIAVARAGARTVLIAPAARPDNRTTALFAGSVTALDRLGVWRRCRDQAAPLEKIRIVDDRGALLHAPEVVFDSTEVDLPAFGHNIENRHLADALTAQAADIPNLRRVNEAAASVAIEATRAIVALSGGERIAAALLVGADGRSSLCRKAAGIEATEWRYPQAAITCNIRHRRQHHNTSTEFHTRFGPFTLVPLPGDRSSLVWVTDPAEAERLVALDDEALAAAIERGCHSMLGKVAVEPGGRGLFPLAGLTARRLAANRTVLVGETAHAFAPIGAQGLNLGLRDAVAIGECVAPVMERRADPGGDAVLAGYEAARRGDVASRSAAVDLLNRSLLSDFLPVQAVRSVGLALLGNVGPLRRALMRAGVGGD